MHITFRGRRGLPSFRSELLSAAFADVIRRTNARYDDFRVTEFSVQHDHVHALVEADDHAALSRGMRSLMIRAALRFNRVLGRERGKLWGDRYHRRDLKTPRQVRNALVYVLANDKKHHRMVGRVSTRARRRRASRVGSRIGSGPSSPRRWCRREGDS